MLEVRQALVCFPMPRCCDENDTRIKLYCVVIKQGISQRPHSSVSLTPGGVISVYLYSCSNEILYFLLLRKKANYEL